MVPQYNSVFGVQCIKDENQHLRRLNLLPRHEVKRHRLDKSRQNQLRLHQRKMIAGAAVRACAEGQVGVAQEFRLMLWCPAVGIAALWVREVGRVAVKCVGTDGNGHPLGQVILLLKVDRLACLSHDHP